MPVVIISLFKAIFVGFVAVTRALLSWRDRPLRSVTQDIRGGSQNGAHDHEEQDLDAVQEAHGDASDAIVLVGLTIGLLPGAEPASASVGPGEDRREPDRGAVQVRRCVSPKYFTFGYFVNGLQLNSDAEKTSVNTALGTLYPAALRPQINAALKSEW